MKVKLIEKAGEEAKRFILAYENLKFQTLNNPDYIGYLQLENTVRSKESAALKRASLDLSRALSEMRK